MMRQRARVEPTLRAMRLADVDAILALEREAFPEIPDERLWTRAQVESHIRTFPEAQWVVEKDGAVLGSCMNMLTTWERATTQHRWRDITGGGTISTHRPDGDTLYGTEIMVSPRARRMGLGRRMFERRFAFVVERGLRGFVTGGRLPGYATHRERMPPQEYIEAVARDEMTDPVLTPELRWGLVPIGIFAGYMMDPASCHYATIVAWENPERAAG
ncbi:MAG TPA: GNAT family N-acetyltransferase [Candidatus Thermoplasmatota archaeon]|nr:GNAT family N-acetyltransferase [Candidatus Thermoplasmatota archaeon]